MRGGGVPARPCRAQPAARLAATAQRVGPTNLAERVETAGLPSELFVLAERFNAMLDRLQENFALLSRFSADIAHELPRR